MANSGHLRMLDSGLHAWNRWRRDEPAVRPDLSGVSIDLADLRLYDLRSANLSGSRLWHVDLSGACLDHANLRGGNLSGSSLSGASMIGANLTNTYARGARFDGCNLAWATIARATLDDAHLEGVNFQDASLEDVSLIDATFGRAPLWGAKRPIVRLGGSQLIDCDLSWLAAGHVHVDRPCPVDWRTVARSLRAPDLQPLLCKLGMPDVIATYLVDSTSSLDPQRLFAMLQSTLISYGKPDEDFARKLRDALALNGVRTWFFPKDAQPGETLHAAMRKAVNSHDRMILICSRSSLDRTGLLNELELLLKREARDGGEPRLIPITLDDYVFTSDWAPSRDGLRQEVLDRVVANFRGALDDETIFRRGLESLLRALRRAPVVPDQ